MESITDELRTGGIYRFPSNRRVFTEEELTAIADRIDAEHQKVVDEWKAKDGQTWLRGYGECHAELMEGNEVIAESLEEAGWVKLPVDADGVPIHVGDVMENIVCPPVHREVTGVGVECFYGWDEGNGRYSQFGANSYRHHHAPTVEDVLREMLKHFGAIEEVTPEVAEYIAEYAAKLTLRGDE